MNRCSLRVRLLRILLIPIALAFVVIGVASYYSSYHEAEEIYDAQLTHFAKVLHALIQHEIDMGDVSEKRVIINRQLQLSEYEKNFAYRVWLGDKVILHSSNADSFGPALSSEGFIDKTVGNEPWRFFVLRDSDVIIEVAERYEVRIDLINHILQGIFLPQLLIIPSLALIIWLGVVSGLRPLTTLSSMIRNRTPDNLEKIEAPVIPREIAPVVYSINDLMSRISDVLEREKQFTNYAAHELRTPLAALKTQLQVASRTDDEEKARVMFKEMLPAIDRMQHLVEQLLMFVRIKAAHNRHDCVDLAAICHDVLKEMAPAAADDSRDLESDISANTFVSGNAEMLAALFRNLVSNALKYTREGGRIHVTLKHEVDRIVLRVMDDGIGIADKECQNIFDSFYRVPGTGTEGCGLGLAIVKWVADMHNATISLGEGLNGKGTGFTVSFTPYSS